MCVWCAVVVCFVIPPSIIILIAGSLNLSPAMCMYDVYILCILRWGRIITNRGHPTDSRRSVTEREFIFSTFFFFFVLRCVPKIMLHLLLSRRTGCCCWLLGRPLSSSIFDSNFFVFLGNNNLCRCVMVFPQRKKHHNEWRLMVAAQKKASREYKEKKNYFEDAALSRLITSERSNNK